MTTLSDYAMGISPGVVAPSPEAGWEKGPVSRLQTDKLLRLGIPELVGNPNTMGSTTEGAKSTSLEVNNKKSQVLNRSKLTANYCL